MRPRAGRTSAGSLRAPELDARRQRSGPVPSAHDAASGEAEAAGAARSSADVSHAGQTQRERLRAAGQDAIAAAFFASHPAVDTGEPEDWGAETPPLDPATRRAMWATFAILALALIAIGGYVAYHRLVMPVPVELHTTQPVDRAH